MTILHLKEKSECPPKTCPEELLPTGRESHTGALSPAEKQEVCHLVSGPAQSLSLGRTSVSSRVRELCYEVLVTNSEKIIEEGHITDDKVRSFTEMDC